MAYQQNTILNTLVDIIDARLEDKLVTSVTDETKAGLIRPGKLQDDPTTFSINILIHTGNDLWKHEINFKPEGLISPAYATFGGVGTFSAFLIRRFIVELELFFDNEFNRAKAREKANIVLARAEDALQTMTNFPPTDDFGETVYAVQVCSSYIREGGGEGTFIWRGQIFLEFLTERT